MGTWMTKYIHAGISDSSQVANDPRSVSFARNLNFRSQNDTVRLNKRLVKDSGTAIDALPVWIDDIDNTVYAYLNNGKIFERVANASWSNVKTVSASTGQGLGTDSEALYYANASFVGRFPKGGTWGVDNDDDWAAITGSSWNPIKYFSKVDLLCVGSDNTLGVYDYGSATYSNTRLTMPRGWHIRDLNEWGDYMVISLWTGANLRQSNTGLIALWDGFAEVPNAYIDSQAGNIQLTQTDKNFLNVFSGVIGDIYRLNAGELYQKTKLPFVNENDGDFVEINPGAKTNFKAIPHFGVAGNSSGASIQAGVYSYGTNKGGIPSSLNLEYTISTDNNDASEVTIGSIHASSNADFYVGWYDSGVPGYGIDKIDNTKYYDEGWFETMQFHGSIAEEGYLKTPMQVKLQYEPLASGTSILSEIASDFNSTWTQWLEATEYQSVQDQSIQLGSGNPPPTGRVLKSRVTLNNFDDNQSKTPVFISQKIKYDVRPTS